MSSTKLNHPKKLIEDQMSQDKKDSKSQLLKKLSSDLEQLKENFNFEKNKREENTDWIQSTFKSVLNRYQDDMTEKFNEEFTLLKAALEQEKKFSREITTWIKTNLGVNLEKINDLVSSSIESESKRQELETKKREESLWIIFGKKYEQQMLEFTEENNRNSEERKRQDKKQWESFSQSFQEQRIEYEQLREKSMQELEQKLESERREIEKNQKNFGSSKKEGS